MSIILAILALSFLVFFHELGHFLAAKFFGVGVLEFSIGMGPRIFSCVIHNTRYSIKLLPLGGSCAMLGEDAAGSGDFTAAEGEEKGEVLDFDGVQFRKEDLDKESFDKKPSWQRFIICFGGVFNNFLLAFLCAVILTAAVGTELPIIGRSTVETAATKSGLKDGDQIIGIAFSDGNHRSIATLQELSLFIQLHQSSFQKGEVKLTVVRDGKKEHFQFSPYKDEKTGLYRLGVQLQDGRKRVKNGVELFRYSYYEFRFNARLVFDSLSMILKGEVSRKEVMGPVGTVAVIGSAVEKSSSMGVAVMLLVLLNLSLMLSVNLGIMNLLPVPALDGGRLLFILLEMLFRRRLNPKWEERINAVGMILLLLLMFLLLFNDAWNLFSGAYSKVLNG